MPVATLGGRLPVATLGRKLPIATGTAISSSLEFGCLDEQLLSVCGGNQACVQPTAMFWQEHGGLDLVRCDCALVSLDQLTHQNHIQLFTFGEF